MIAILLLTACIVILLLQIAIVRQIGVLHHRLGPETPDVPLPTQTRLEVITYSNGAIRSLRELPTFACIIVSTSCEMCHDLLDALTLSGLPEGLSIGVAGGGDGLAEVRQRYRIPGEVLFDAQAIAKDLAVTSVPVMIILDSALKVTHRGTGLTRDSVLRQLNSAVQPGPHHARGVLTGMPDGPVLP
jgi:hypothetical protein